MKFAKGSEKTLSQMDGFCQSRYCHIPNLDSNDWTVQAWGVDPAATDHRILEISVVRNSNAHGRLSYGSPPKTLWPKFVQIAQEHCDELNKQDS